MPANRTHDFAKLLVSYADNDEPTFEIPADLSTLDDEALAALHEQAVSMFDTVYGDGSELSSEDLATLAQLTEGIETLLAEQSERAEAAAERTRLANELAARVRPDELSRTDPAPDSPPEGMPDDAEEPEEVALEPDETQRDVPGSEPHPETGESSGRSTGTGTGGGSGGTTPNGNGDQDAANAVAASAGRRSAPIRVSLSSVASRQPRRSNPRPAAQASSMQDIVLAADVPGFHTGQGLDWDGVGRAIDRRLQTYNHSQYVNAERSGRAIKEQYGVATIRKPFADDLVVSNNDPSHVDSVIQHAVDEHRLPGGSLVASGGWCAPSEVIYDLCELESRDGLFSLPEIGIARGGISFTPGPDFTTIYASPDFEYTEAEDIAGTYVDGTPNTVGSKPCYKVVCPTFQEKRLGTTGLCIRAGLLMSRGYPEVIARVVRGALIAHDHKMSGRLITDIIAGSTAVTMPAAQAGAVSPLLTAIELQVEHFRYTSRISRSTTLEAVFPFWVRGAIRTDLGRRLGMNLQDVTDAQIDSWFSMRGIAPQYIYNWQDIQGTAAASFTNWPTTVKFLLYAAGTWIRGSSDVITLDTLYDSTLLGTNDYTALFTEEGTLTAKLCHDSRVVTVNICPDGATAAGVLIDCLGVAS